MKNRTCRMAWIMIALLLTALQSFGQSYEPYTFTTLAGSVGYGNADGVGSAARFSGPSAMAIDSAGNVYVLDQNSTIIRKVTPAGVVTTLAAWFYYPRGVAVDSSGNVYVAGPPNPASGGHSLRKVTPAGVVTELAVLVDETGSDSQSGTSSTRFYRARLP